MATRAKKTIRKAPAKKAAKKTAKPRAKPKAKKRPGKRTGKPVGRRSLIHDQTLVGQLLENVQKGNALKASAEAVGISQMTLHEWRLRGEQAVEQALKKMGLSGDEPIALAEVLKMIDERERPFAVFAERLARARARAKTTLHDRMEELTRCGDKRVRLDALRFLLARRYPEDYGRRDALEVSGNEDKPVGINLFLPELEPKEPAET